MELITERVAAGLDVRPTKARKHNKHARVNTTEGGIRSGQKDGPEDPHRRSEDKERSVNWKKWGERAAIGKTWAEDSKRLVGGRQVFSSSSLQYTSCLIIYGHRTMPLGRPKTRWSLKLPWPSADQRFQPKAIVSCCFFAAITLPIRPIFSISCPAHLRTWSRHHYTDGFTFYSPHVHKPKIRHPLERHSGC